MNHKQLYSEFVEIVPTWQDVLLLTYAFDQYKDEIIENDYSTSLLLADDVDNSFWNWDKYVADIIYFIHNDIIRYESEVEGYVQDIKNCVALKLYWLTFELGDDGHKEILQNLIIIYGGVYIFLRRDDVIDSSDELFELERNYKGSANDE